MTAATGALPLLQRAHSGIAPQAGGGFKLATLAAGHLLPDLGIALREGQFRLLEHKAPFRFAVRPHQPVTLGIRQPELFITHHAQAFQQVVAKIIEQHDATFDVILIKDGRADPNHRFPRHFHLVTLDVQVEWRDKNFTGIQFERITEKIPLGLILQAVRRNNHRCARPKINTNPLHAAFVQPANLVVIALGARKGHPVRTELFGVTRATLIQHGVQGMAAREVKQITADQIKRAFGARCADGDNLLALDRPFALNTCRLGLIHQPCRSNDQHGRR